MRKLLVTFMRTLLATFVLLAPVPGAAQPVASTYATRDGRVDTVVIACPSQDGTYTAGACSLTKPGPVTYAGPAAFSITAANTAITVFTSGSIASGCDVVNSASGVLYIDFTTTAAIGSATSLPLQPGQAYHCPFAPAGPMSAVAAQPQSFVAVRY